MQNSRRNFLAGAAAGSPLIAAQAADHSSAPALDSEKFRAAILNGDAESAARFMDRDPALAYARDAQGNSVYLLACLAGQTKMAEMLVSRGLRLDIFEAAAAGNVKRATELCDASPGIQHARSADGRTPLHYAAAAGQMSTAAFLNGKGVDLSAGPESPLIAIADHANLQAAADLAALLLANASDPNAKRKDGKSALHLAAARGNEVVVRALIHRGADVDARDANGKTPLDCASGPAIETLRNAANIEKAYYGVRYKEDRNGAPVSREDTYGLPQNFINDFVTVAHFDPEKVKKLHRMCPSLLMTRATWDELAIEAAAHMGLAPLAEYLADAGSPVSTCTGTLLGLADHVKSLIATDRNCVRERGAHDLPLLFYTVFAAERAEIADILLRAGTDPAAQGFGLTTLHLAARKGYIEVTKLLLDRGADINASSKGGTPLAMAVQAKQDKAAAFLRARGAV